MKPSRPRNDNSLLGNDAYKNAKKKKNSQDQLEKIQF